MRNSDQTARASNSDGAFLCAPFFQAPVSNALPLRRLLLISFHFPPGGAARYGSGLSPLHSAQIKTYLKLTGLNLGLIINFNVILLKDGIKRVIYHP